MSGWQDSNLRPPAPKAGAITGLRYTPKGLQNIKNCFTAKFDQKYAERKGFEPPVPARVQLLSRSPVRPLRHLSKERAANLYENNGSTKLFFKLFYEHFQWEFLS